MTTPSSLKINLPPKFVNSFWSSPDYRRGVEALYSRLQHGIDEDDSIIALVQHRAAAEYSHAEQLATPCPLPSFESPLFKGALREGGNKAARSFSGNDTSASHAFRTIEAEYTRVQAGTHAKVARNLENHILLPFGKWSEDHKDKIYNSWEYVDANLQKFERQKIENERVRSHYETKCRQADEAEDDARFAGGEVASPAILSSESNSTKDNSLTSDKESIVAPENTSSHTSIEEEAPLDLDRLKRRETIREQFGFRRASTTSQSEKTEEKATQGQRSISGELSSPRAALNPQNGGEEDSSALLRRSNTFSSALSSAFSKASEVPALQNLRAVVGGMNEPKHIRLRKDAEVAELQYKDAVRNLDKIRCELEEILSEHFVLTERWEMGRLIAVRRVLNALNASFLPLLPTMSASFQRCSALESVIDPQQSLAHLILDARTGSYQPKPQVFHPYYHDDPNSLSGAGTAGFGMHLSAFMRAETLASEEGSSGEVRAGAGNSHKVGMPAIPIALMAMLAILERLYDDESRWVVAKLDPEKEKETKAEKGEGGGGGKAIAPTSKLTNEEKRKSWIYEVPLTNSHMCREAIISHLLGNSVPGANVGAGLEAKLKRFDPPTLAATVKLWAIELADSLIPSEQWDAVDNTYRAAASQEYEARATPNKTVAEAKSEDSKESNNKGKSIADEVSDPVLEETIRKGVLADLSVILSRLPKIHLICLDAIIGHLSKLIKITPSAEEDVVYINKLALALGRVLLRPPIETSKTLQSRAPSLLAFDLIQYYDDLFPSILDKRSKESEAAQTAQRKTPIRKRTKPIDQRMSRSKMSSSHDPMPIIFSNDHKRSQSNQSSQSATTQGTSAALPPKLQTTLLPKDEMEDSSSTPTPIASRLLGSDFNQLSNKDSLIVGAEIEGGGGGGGGGEISRIKSPSSTSATSSSYDTPDEADEKAAIAAMESSTMTPSTSQGENIDEGKPLSNVARLSRQFASSNSSGSVKSMVRGPRAAK